MATAKKSTAKKSTASKKAAAPAVTLEDVLGAVNALNNRFDALTEHVNSLAVSASEPDVDVEEDVEEEELEAPDRETVEGLGIKELRALAAEYGIESTKKAEILAEFEDLYDEDDEDEEEDEDDEDEDDEDEADDDDEDEDDEEDEDEELDRDDLEEMSLKELRVLAKENGHTAADYKGMDQDAIIDLILGEDEEEDEDDEDEDDEDEEVLDEDALNEMTQKDLLSLAKELDLKVPAALKKNSKANHKKLVALILDSGEEE